MTTNEVAEGTALNTTPLQLEQDLDDWDIDDAKHESTQNDQTNQQIAAKNMQENQQEFPR